MKLRVLIADDELLSRQRLRQFLHVEPGAEVVAECASGTDAVKVIREESPDLAFLDVKMPGLDAFGVMQAVDGARAPAIVFVTAHDDFAVQAFEANAVDYLLKPFNRERFQAAFRRARERIQGGPSNHNIPPFPGLFPDPGKSGKPLERLTIRSGGRISILKTVEIDWICASDNYVELHVGGVMHLLRVTLTALAGQLPNQFIRISRSRLVNAGNIKEVHSKPHGDFVILLHNGARLPGTRNYRRNLRQLLGRLR